MKFPVLLCSTLALAVSLGGLAPLAAHADSTKTWDHLSTGLTFGLGGAAALTTFSKHDNTGIAQGLKTAGASFLVAELLKSVVHETRPDGSDNRSFPSAQTAAAFAAAGYFDIRYGQEYHGYVPVMYGLAALTGYARVKAKKHHAQDVIAGAAIGWGMAHVFTTPYVDQIAFAPTSKGMSLSYTKKF